MSNLFHKLRFLLLSPKSSAELILRSYYHRLAATRFYFYWQDFLAKHSFVKYKQNIAEKFFPASHSISTHRVTFFVSCVDSKPAELQETLESLCQYQENPWDAFIFTNDDRFDHVITRFEKKQIIRASSINSDLVKIATGEFIIFCEAGDKFNHNLFWYLNQALIDQPEAQILYYDCEFRHEKTGKPTPFFKPASSSPALLLSVNYLSRSFIRREKLIALGIVVDFNQEILSREYDIVLLLCEVLANINHIPALLVYQKRLVTPTHPENLKIITAQLEWKGLTSVKSTKEKFGIRFSWATGHPSLAVVIPSKNNRTCLEPLVHSLINQPYPGKTSIHIVDNGSEDPATLSFYQDLKKEQQISVIPYNKPFNYSEAINYGVSDTDSTLVLLLNDDMALTDHISIPELVQWAIRPEIGVVGAKLVRSNRTIQHAGIILGMAGFMGHIYLNAPEEYFGLFGSVNWYRNYLALTGACQMVRRDVFDEVGGYDTAYQLAFGDIDFCVKIFEKGYQNIFTPFAQIVHYEGHSRGYHSPESDILRGYDQMEKYMLAGDPFFSPNLTYSRLPKCVTKKDAEDQRHQQIAIRKQFYTMREKP